MANLFPPLGSQGVRQSEHLHFSLHLTKALILFKWQEMLPKCSLWLGFTQRVKSMTCIFHLQTQWWQAGHDMKYNRLELRQQKVHLSLIPEVLFLSIVSKTQLPHHFYAYLKFQLLLMRLRIAPSVYATDFTFPLFSLIPCYISLHDPFLLLPVVLLHTQLYVLPLTPSELGIFLMKIPATLHQSLSIVLLYL